MISDIILAFAAGMLIGLGSFLAGVAGGMIVEKLDRRKNDHVS